MSKKCPKCGTFVEDNAKFCDECGVSLSNVLSQAVLNETPPREEPKINMYNDYHMGDRAYAFVKGVAQNSTTSVVTQSSGSKVLGILSLICGILSIITFGCWFLPEIVAIICGVLSKDINGKKTKLGKAGFICGIVGCVMLIIFILIVIFAVG